MNGDIEGRLRQLFHRGERLGWEFRDRLGAWRHFAEPPPRDIVPEPRLWQRLQRATARRQGVIGWAIAGAVAGLLSAGYLVSSLGSGPGPLSVLAVAGLAVAGWLVLWRPLRLARAEHMARHDLEDAQAEARRQYETRLQAWNARGGAHTTAEWERVNRLPEWGAVRTTPGTRRLDVFGGSLASWEGFLTTFGASMLAESPPVRVLDLSEARVAEELCRLAEARGMAVDAQLLPRQLATSDLVEGLDARQLADLVIESVHGDGRREARAIDARILRSICEALAPDLSLARIHEALQALLGQPARPVHLSREEWDSVVRDLFSPAYLDSARDRIQSLEAQLHPLRELGAAAPPASQPRSADLQCLMVSDADDGLAGDLLVDLAAQWTIRDLRGGQPARRPRVLIVAGADRLGRRNLEKLADVCERGQVRLVYLFRHLREDAADLLGSGGAAAFMRLGNADEAERAARFIGRGHRFVLSQVTRAHGTNQTHAAGESEGQSVGTSRTAGQVGTTTTRSRSWGVTSSYAEGTNWHYAVTGQRVYEYEVEPTTLQSLPDYALLLVQHGPAPRALGAPDLAGAPRILVADCNPDIVSLPRVIGDPLPAPGSAELDAIEAPRAAGDQGRP